MIDIMESELEKIKSLSRCLVRLYFEQGAADEIKKYMSKSITWIGIEKSEVNYSMGEINHFLDNKEKIFDKSFHIFDENYMAYMVREDVGIVMIVLKVKPENDDLDDMLLRCSLVWSKDHGEWKVVHIHGSIPDKYLEKTVYSHLNADAMQKETTENLKQATLMDSLTHICNMEGYVEESRNIFETYPNETYAVIKFGIKDFRYINRTQGYSFGDKVLACIGKNLQLSCQEYETCGRIEKDMFAILYRFSNKKEFDQRMHAVREKLIDKDILDQIGIKIHFTAGVYIPEDIHKESIKSMLDKALLAQMSVENDKYDYYSFFEKKMIEEKEENSRILEMAPIALKNQEFLLYIQPQFDIYTKEIIGGEALTRWKHQGEMIMPNRFIPLFEENGYINEFDFYMLEKLCQTMKHWITEGRKMIPISINQSRRHLNEEGYIERFTKIVDQYSIPHQYIVFELTESAFVRYENQMKKLSQKLHSLGYLLAIDDFGTGYASLNFLSQITADILKIDKSLIDNYKTNRKTHTIVEKVIDMAHDMDMIVVCEGIEVQEQIEYLKALDCDIGQGYVIGRPIEAEMFKKVWLTLPQIKG